jgi:sugar phosphate isomerase/epimerase
MPHPAFSLAYLTAPDLSPPDMLRAAASAGYQYVGIRLLPATPGGPVWELMDDLALLAERSSISRSSALARTFTRKTINGSSKPAPASARPPS